MKKLNSDMIAQMPVKARAPSRENEKKKAFLLGTFEWTQAVILAVVIVAIVLTFVFRFVDVSGDSMLDTLMTNDKVLVSTFFYKPECGDIVVISHAQKYEKPIVKRVIATENQSVDIDFDTGKVYVDGNEIDEPYLTHNIVPGTTDISFPVTVPEGCIFVLGDNRPVSLDSRYTEIGFIKCSNVVGKVRMIVYPLDRISFVN